MSIELMFTQMAASLEANTQAMLLLTESLAGRSAPAAKAAADKAKALHASEVAEGIADAEAGNTIPLEDVKAKIGAKAADRKADPKPEVVEAGAVSYETVRNLVLKLAPTSRDAIKALNGKHGIATLRDLLADEKDFASVKDQPKLEAIHADLLELEAV